MTSINLASIPLFFDILKRNLIKIKRTFFYGLLMLKIIKRLPLSVKLLLICLIPISLSIYFSVMIYQEKSERINILESSIDLIHESSNIQDLIVALSWERRYSFNYLQNKERLEKLNEQKTKTDSIIEFIKNSTPKLGNFPEYTFLNQLENIRNLVLNDPKFSVKSAISYYTNTINRINMMDAPMPLGNLFFKESFEDHLSQNVINKMINLLGTVRTNVYIGLYSQGIVTNRNISSSGYYRMFKSYEDELELNSTPETLRKYDSVSALPDYSRMISSLDVMFSDSFQSDSSFTAETWWNVTSSALTSLRSLQSDLYKNSEQELINLYNKEKASQKKTLLFLIISIIVVIIIIVYFAAAILKSLQSLEHAAYKISQGNTGIELNSVPSGLMGNLGRSILEIEKNNLLLANAANEIGKGNFDVIVTPRSKHDLLGHSLEKMKQDLKEFNSQKDQIQKETLQLVHNRDEFFSMTSHELKTPVTSLKAYTQLLLMEGYSFEEGKGRMMLEKMDQQINKLVTLINDLLDTSRLQYGEMQYSKEPLKLNSLVNEVIQEIKMSNPDHKIIFQKNINGTILGNPDRLRQVINNLITNAIKYAPDSNEIIIRLDKKDNNIMFSIKDFGYGIKKEDIPHIFDRFFRVSEDNLHTYPGLGVGLFISNEFIKRHGGRMWLESEYKKGSTFYFELPLMES